MSERVFPAVKVRHNVVCQSARSIARPSLIVIHDTEGANIPHSARDLVGLGNFFNEIATQASSHVATDLDGTSARYVPDGRKAWSQAFYNSPGLSIEQIGFAVDDWHKREPQIRETARWVAYWSRKWGIPIQRAQVSLDGRVLRAGVIQHRDLGNLGGAHHDVSELYPMGAMLVHARRYRRLQASRKK